MRATSSIRSSSIAKSKRYVGGVTSNVVFLTEKSNCNRCNISVILDSSSLIPNMRCTLSARKIIDLRFGNSPFVSVIGPGLPPQISIINSVALSMAVRVAPKSTPRSNR